MTTAKDDVIYRAYDSKRDIAKRDCDLDSKLSKVAAFSPDGDMASPHCWSRVASSAAAPGVEEAWAWLPGSAHHKDGTVQGFKCVGGFLGEDARSGCRPGRLLGVYGSSGGPCSSLDRLMSTPFRHQASIHYP